MPPHLRSGPDDSSLNHYSPAPRRRRPRIAIALETGSCIHINSGLGLPCSCGSSRKPVDPSLYANGVIKNSNNITDKFLRENLNITQVQLDFLVGCGMEYKQSITAALGTRNVDLELSNQNTWRMIDTETNSPVLLEGQIAALMVEKSAVLDVDVALLPGPELAAPGSVIKWSLVPEEIINLRTGTYDLTKYEAKQFLCTFVVPNLMHLLQLSPKEHTLSTHIMAIPAPMRGYLLYHVAKSKIVGKRLNEWKEVLRTRTLNHLIDRARASQPNTGRPGNQEGELKIKQLEKRLEDVIREGQVDRGFLEALSKQVEMQDTRHKAQDSQLVAFDARIMDHDRQIHSHDEMLGEQGGMIRVQDKRVGALDEKQAAQGERLGVHDGKLREQDGKLLEHNGKLQEQDERLLAHDNRLRANEGALRTQAGQIEDIQENAGSLLKDAVTAFNASLDLKFADLVAPRVGPAPDNAVVPPLPPLLYLRLRDCSEESEDSIPEPAVFKRIWCSGEDNKLVSNAVTFSISLRTPFVIVLVGYSGSGKSYTAFGQNGLLSAILKRLPPTLVSVSEVLEQKKSLESYSTEEVTAVMIGAAISKSRRSAATVANHSSSRAHLAVTFENPESDHPFGMLLDVAGPELSENIEQLDGGMARDSVKIAQDNTCIRQLLFAIATGADLKVQKRGSKLNLLLFTFLESVTISPLLRVVVCGDGSQVEMVNKTMGMVPGL